MRHDDGTEVGGENITEDLVATQDMCNYCFDVLLEKILRDSAPTKRHARSIVSAAKKQFENKHDGGGITKRVGTGEGCELFPQLGVSPSVECPLFVTWEKRVLNSPLLSPISSGFTTPTSSSLALDDDNSNQDSSEYILRGCIGTLSSRPLGTALSEFALASALRDKRFDPISLQELRELRVGVSLLVKYEECLNCFDWVVGTHGIIVRFKIDRGGRLGEDHYSATYLPEVAYEQGWNQDEAVISLVRKAGYRGSISNQMLEQIHCIRYQSSKCRSSYQEYLVSKGYDDDPLRGIDVLTAATVDRALRHDVNASKTCVNL
eukprot:CCRYP_002074-RA/>CCRYP_002074-RA protein AED:0.05 eAED:0.05 QI:228/1/1/1/0.5/0.33/3/347/319